MRAILILIALSVVVINVNAIPVTDGKWNEEDDNQDVEEEDITKHPYGRPINIIKFDDEGISIDNAALEEIFNHADVKDRKIVAVSIIGAFRKGKSFLMDYALRYMYANYKSVAFPNNTLANRTRWIGDPEAPLKGFSWRGGAARDTTGVVIWSDVFLHWDLAIVLIDTQGLFDQEAAPTENSRIFALGTLVSSLQIFNLNDVIQEDQLQYLQLATGFAKLALNSGKKGRKGIAGKPFQSLLFLMRDWQNQQEYDYGSDGGAQYLARTLTVRPEQPEELKEVRRFIEKSYDTRLCFLMPHPGLKVIGNKAYEGEFSWLSKEFQEHLQDFVPWILGSSKLKIKKILDSEVSGSEYLEYLKMYFDVFKSDEIPEVGTLHRITIEKQHDIIVEAAFKEYRKSLQKIEFKTKSENGTEVWKEKKTMEQELDENFSTAKGAAEKVFKDKKKMGDKADEIRSSTKLKDKMQQHFDEWKTIEMISYVRLKTLEENQARELERLKNEQKLEMERQQKAAEDEKKRLEDIHKQKMQEMNTMIENLNTSSVSEVKKLKEDMEAKAKEQETKFAEEKKRMDSEAKKKQEKFEKDLSELRLKMERKAQEAKANVNNNKESEVIKIFMLKAKEREKEIERQIKLEKEKEERREEQRRIDQQTQQDMLRVMRESMEKAAERAREAEERRTEQDRLDAQLKIKEKSKLEEMRIAMQQQQQAAQREMMTMFASLFGQIGMNFMKQEADQKQKEEEEQRRKLALEKKIEAAKKRYKMEQERRDRILEEVRAGRLSPQFYLDPKIQDENEQIHQDSEGKQIEEQEADADASNSRRKMAMAMAMTD